MRGKVVTLILLLFIFSTSFVSAEEALTDELVCKRKIDFADYISFITDFMGRPLRTTPCFSCHDSQGFSGFEVPAPVPRTGQSTSYIAGDDGNVRKGIRWPDPRFTDNGDGTVTDELTGLIWLKNANCFGTQNWNQSLLSCKMLATGLCGLSDGSVPDDWRLPNIEELLSLVDRSQMYPALPSGHPFGNVQPSYYWSSTTSVFDGSFAWYLWLGDGFSDFDPKTGLRYVWPVRGGL
jgi:hypothetical protein